MPVPVASWCRRCCRRRRWSGRRNFSPVCATPLSQPFATLRLIDGFNPDQEHAMTTTSGSAKWQGGIKDGKGAISTKSGALNDYPYGFASRFEGKPGSNPEELIGAAHAACFTMALSLILGEAKLTAEQMETKADVTLEKQGDGFAITSVHLMLTAKVPGADNANFQQLAGNTREGCRASTLLSTSIGSDATLAYQ